MSMAKGAPGLDLAGAGSCLRTSRTNSILFRPPFIRSPLTLISSFILRFSLSFQPCSIQTPFLSAPLNFYFLDQILK